MRKEFFRGHFNLRALGLTRTKTRRLPFVQLRVKSLRH